MASGWDVGSKSVIRNNGRNTGAVIWNQDLVAAQVVDANGHDINDQTLADSITETLNINGINAMLADLDFGGFKGIGLLDGVAATDAVNKGQLDGGLSGKVGEAPIDGNNYNRKDAAWEVAAGGTNPDDIIVGQSWDGQIFKSTRATADFDTTIRSFDEVVVTSFKSNGPIRQVLDNLGAGPNDVDVSLYNRHRVNNDAALTLTFINLPTDNPDPDLGANYTVEGRITILNGAAPGTITLADLGTPTIIGAQNTDVGAGQVLTYIIDRVSGVNHTTIVWSAA